MDIINYYTYTLKKRVLMVLSFLLTFYGNAQNDTLSSSKFKREFELEIFDAYYKYNPSLIDASNIKKFAYGNVQYKYAEGDLKLPQAYKKLNGFSLKTESINNLDSTNWTLYGKMDYLNTRNENVETNLSYNIYDYNSPYYFFQKKEGLWNVQHYDLSLIGNNKISEKIALGGEFDYKTNFYYRKIDTRNNQKSLTLNAKISGSYYITPNQRISTTLGREFYKSESELSNHFPANKTTEEYQIYLNTGLGSYLKSISSGAMTKRNLYNLKLNWLYKHYNHLLLLSSYTMIGKEKWVDKNINKVSSNNEITKYLIFKQDLSFNYIIRRENNSLHTSILVNYLNGKGNMWDSINNIYNQNFESEQYKIQGKLNYLMHDRMVRNLELDLVYENNKNQDQNYGYQLNYTFITSDIAIGFSKNLNENLNLYIKPGASLKYVLNNTHTPYAARNLYVDWIGNPLAHYLDINQYSLKNQLGFNIKLLNSILDIETNVEYWKPIDQKYVSDTQKYHDYLFVGINTTLFF